jgi:hypothetical protein
LDGALPAGVNAFNPPVDVSVGAASGSPAIAASSLTAGPNNTITVTGNELSTYSGETHGSAYSDSQFLVYGESGGVGTLAPAQTQDTLNTASTSAGGALVTIPSSEPGDSMYLIWAENANGATTPIAINQTNAQWFSLIPSTTEISSPPSQTTGGVLTTYASSGQTVYVYGRNLSNGTTSWVYLENTAGTAGEYAPVSSVNPYQVEFTLPGNLPSGAYRVWVNNGLGGNYGWSEAPGIISTTESPTAYPTEGEAGWFDVTASPYNTDNTGKNDAYPGIEAALTAIATYRSKAGNANAPVTLYFPNGTYNVVGDTNHDEQILLPSNIQVLGASRTGTTLEFAQEADTGYGLFDIGFNDSINNPYTNVEYNSLTITYYGPDTGTNGDLIRAQYGRNLVFTNVTLNSESLEAVDFCDGRQITVMNSSVIGGGVGDELFVGGTQNVTIMNDEFYLEYGTEAAVYTGNNGNFAFFDSTAQDYNDSLNAENLPNDPTGWGQGRLLEDNVYDGSISNEYIGGNQTIGLGSPTRINGGEQILFENGDGNEANGKVQSVSGDTIVLPLSAEVTLTGTTVSASQVTKTQQTTVVGNFSGAPSTGEIVIYDGQLLTIGSVTASSAGNPYTLTLDGLFTADPADGNSLVIVNPPSSGQSAIVANGTGMGQIATVQSVVQGTNSVTLTLSGGLRIPLDTSSVVVTSNTVTNSVIYNNTLQDQTGPYGATADAGPALNPNVGLGAAGGVQLANGAYNVVIDGNTIENTNGGIVLYGFNLAGYNGVSCFIDIANNTIENVHESGITISPNTLPQDLADVGVNVRGNTIEWNDSAEWSNALTLNAHIYYGLGDGDTEPEFVNPDDTQNPTGIIIGGSTPDEAHIESAAHYGGQWTPGQTTATLTVVEQNVVTTAIGGQSALGLGVFQDPDVLVCQNTFNAGSAPDTSVPAVAFCDLYAANIGVITDPQALLSGNIYENYSQSCVETQFTGAQDHTPSEGMLPTPLLQTPNYAFSLTVLAGQHGELSLPILDDGVSALRWSATSSSSSLTFLSSSGSINAESSGNAVLVIDTSTAGSGTYTVTISDGGQEKEISIYLNVLQGVSDVIALDTWKGTVSTEWSNPNNWSGSVTPDSNDNVVINSGTVTASSAFSIAGLVLNGGTLQLGIDGGNGIYTASSLTISNGGTLDVGNNELIINYGNNADPKTTILSYLRSGYNGGSWTGPGIDSSAAALSKGAYGVGFADGADGIVRGLSSGQIELKYTLNGDANLDGMVNGADFNILAANFNRSVTGWDQGDFNYDGLVNGADFLDLAANFNQGINLNTPGLLAGSGAIYTITGSTGAQTLDILSGSVTLTTDLSTMLPNYSLQIENGASVILASDQHIGALQLVGSGSLDMSNYTMFINYGSNSDPISVIAGYIRSGYNGGGWNGQGIISTAAQTRTNGLYYGLGYADGKDGVVSGLSSGQIEIKYTLLGDANLDGLVNAADFNILAANVNQSVTGWDQGDFNYDSLVNGADFLDLAANFNQGASGASVASSAAVLAAPAAPAVASRTPTMTTSTIELTANTPAAPAVDSAPLSVATVATKANAAVPPGSKSKPVSVSKAVIANGRSKASAVTTYAASVVTIPTAGSTTTPQDTNNKNAKFLADR